eukprot:1950600-Amphidinium_carterae.1
MRARSLRVDLTTPVETCKLLALIPTLLKSCSAIPFALQKLFPHHGQSMCPIALDIRVDSLGWNTFSLKGRFRKELNQLFTESCSSFMKLKP